MTEDFKKQLLNVLTDNFNKTVGDDNQHLINITNISSEKIQEHIPSNAIRMILNGIIEVPEKFGKYFVIYGGYITNTVNAQIEEANGWICILDDKCIPIKSFTKFKSGTDLRYIDKMIVDEEGNFYAVDYSYYSMLTNNSQKRLIMLNNFVISNLIYDDFYIILKKSYTLNYSFNDCKDLIKSPLSSNFIFITEVSGYTTEGVAYQNHFLIISLKINVESENEWNTFTSSKVINYIGSYSEFDADDNYSYIVVCISDIANNIKIIQGNKSGIKEFNKSYAQNNVVNPSGEFNTVFYNCDNFYFTLKSIVSPYKSCIFKYSDNTIKTILLEESDTINHTYKFIKNSNNIYVYKYIYDITNKVSQLYFSIMKDDKFNFIKIMERNNYYNSNILIATSNNYNLLTHYCIFPDHTSIYFNEIYNPNNYNGLPYIDNNCLIPNSAVLSSDNHVAFARNLYNKIVNDNITISTVEIPNTYLNDIPINNKQLISETNLSLIKDTSSFIKNIYEKVYINFINSLLIQDRNNMNHIKENLEASIYLNQKINTIDTYKNSKLYNKAILYYEDGTTEEKTYEFIDKKEKSVFIKMLLYILKSLNKIEFVSNDKKTVYHTINADNLEKGKLYKISQKLEVL